jgi:hypothetical protein
MKATPRLPVTLQIVAPISCWNPGRVDAVHKRHGDINDHNVRIEPLGLGYKRDPLAHRANQCKMTSQQSDFGF